MEKRIFFVFFIVILPVLSGYAQSGVEIESYMDKIVSTNVSVTGTDTLKVKEVSIVNNGRLVMTAQECVIIDSSFEVEEGGILVICKPINAYHYDYDPNGNRIRVNVIYNE